MALSQAARQTPSFSQLARCLQFIATQCETAIKCDGLPAQQAQAPARGAVAEEPSAPTSGERFPQQTKPRRAWHALPRQFPPLPWHPRQQAPGAGAALWPPATHSAHCLGTHLRPYTKPATAAADPGAAVNPAKGFVEGGYTVDMFPPERIRNFSIIAHVDHGKSTLADRLMEVTGALSMSKAHPAQYLDKLQVERDRGITVKAQTVSLVYRHTDSQDYLINLIDTPGHVDFSYEVSRSLAACQGALLLVDAGQGVQAQTVANWRLATEQGLFVVPALNKIDLPQADIVGVTGQLESLCGVSAEDVLLLSAKTGIGLETVLPTVVQRVPAPRGSVEAPLRLLLFDAYHDPYRGVIALIEVVDGCVTKGDKVTSMGTGQTWEVLELGVLAPERYPIEELLNFLTCRYPTDKLFTGQVGYVITGNKDLKAARVGDTWTLHGTSHQAEPLPGFRPARSMVYAGLYPMNAADFDELAVAMDRLTLNDASVTVARENSEALGPGFRCGFLGMLHLEVFMQRLEQEHRIEVVTTTPTVPYLVDMGSDQDPLEISRASDLPTDRRVHEILEPTVTATIICPMEYTGKVMDLCATRRGELLEHTVLASSHTHTHTPSHTPCHTTENDNTDTDKATSAPHEQGRCLLRYTLPLSELATDLYGQVKARTQGYATFDYEPGEYRPADLQRLDIIAHGKTVDALARLVHRSEIHQVGRALLTKMKNLVDRQLYEVILQATANGRIIARETIKPLRKDVLAKCYGGDVTRKMKLLQRNREAKSKLKVRSLGTISLPASAFPELMRTR